MFAWKLHDIYTSLHYNAAGMKLIKERVDTSISQHDSTADCFVKNAVCCVKAHKSDTNLLNLFLITFIILFTVEMTASSGYHVCSLTLTVRGIVL